MPEISNPPKISNPMVFQIKEPHPPPAKSLGEKSTLVHDAQHCSSQPEYNAMFNRLPPWIFLCLFLAALGLSLFMALSPAPPTLPIDAFGDKFEHILAFGTMTLLARLAFPRLAVLRLLEHMSFLGALIEVFQAMPQIHRDCDWKDWVADTLASALVLAVMSPLLARWRHDTARLIATSGEPDR